MSEFEGMSWEALRENSSEIEVFIDSLLDDDDRHKLWRKLAIAERGGKGLIGEILGTPHGPLFISRISIDDANGWRGEDPDNRQSPIRGIEPVTGDLDQCFYLTSRRAQFCVDAGYLIARIQAGEREVVLRPGFTSSSKPAQRPTAQQIADYRARSETHRRKQQG